MEPCKLNTITVLLLNPRDIKKLVQPEEMRKPKRN